MENKQENNEFRYTYSAKEQEELKRIREKYTPAEQRESKMERLRRLDRSVTKKGTTVSLILGILGVLILGAGMSLVMTEMGEYFGLQENISMIVGIAIGLVGGILASLAYPSYHLIVEHERKRLAPEILRLTDELMK